MDVSTCVPATNQPFLLSYEIAYAEQRGIPVLCLYRPTSNKGSRLSAMISGSSLVVNHEYETQEEAVALIDQFFEDIDKHGPAWVVRLGGKGKGT